MKLTLREIREIIKEELLSRSFSGGNETVTPDPGPIALEPGLGIPGLGILATGLAIAEIGEAIDLTKDYSLPVPVPSTTGWLGSRAGAQRAGYVHNGDDWKVPENTPLLSVGTGHVVSVERSPGPIGTPKGNCGCSIVLDIDGIAGNLTYCHVNEIHVSPGDPVTKGMPIGLSGGDGDNSCSGRTTGPHLHFSIGGSTDPSVYDALYNISSGWTGLGGALPTTGGDVGFPDTGPGSIYDLSRQQQQKKSTP